MSALSLATKASSCTSATTPQLCGGVSSLKRDRVSRHRSSPAALHSWPSIGLFVNQPVMIHEQGTSPADSAGAYAHNTPTHCARNTTAELLAIGSASAHSLQRSTFCILQINHDNDVSSWRTRRASLKLIKSKNEPLSCSISGRTRLCRIWKASSFFLFLFWCCCASSCSCHTHRGGRGEVEWGISF